MTDKQRHREFRKLFKELSERYDYKTTVTMISGLLYCSESTVRGWQVQHSQRIIPASKFRMLKENLYRINAHL